MTFNGVMTSDADITALSELICSFKRNQLTAVFVRCSTSRIARPTQQSLVTHLGVRGSVTMTENN